MQAHKSRCDETEQQIAEECVPMRMKSTTYDRSTWGETICRVAQLDHSKSKSSCQLSATKYSIWFRV